MVSINGQSFNSDWCKVLQYIERGRMQVPALGGVN